MIFVINYRHSNVGGVRNVSGRYFESKGSVASLTMAVCANSKKPLIFQGFGGYGWLRVSKRYATNMVYQKPSFDLFSWMNFGGAFHFEFRLDSGTKDGYHSLH
jgi:hypothetical protein